MVKAHIISFVTVAPKAKPKKPVKDIQYVSSTLGQFTKAKIEGTDMYCFDNPKELATYIRKQEKGSFDRRGRITAIGRQNRKEELKKLGLPETATLVDVVAKQFEARAKGIAHKLLDISKWGNKFITLTNNL